MMHIMDSIFSDGCLIFKPWEDLKHYELGTKFNRTLKGNLYRDYEFTFLALYNVILVCKKVEFSIKKIMQNSRKLSLLLCIISLYSLHCTSFHAHIISKAKIDSLKQDFANIVDRICYKDIVKQSSCDDIDQAVMIFKDYEQFSGLDMDVCQLASYMVPFINNGTYDINCKENSLEVFAHQFLKFIVTLFHFFS